VPPRYFLALTLPEVSVSALVDAQETFVACAPAWAGEKWVAAPLLHVTVAFLGPLDDRALEAGVARLSQAAASVPAFELRPSAVVAVPSPRRATMLWATFEDPADHLTALRDGLLTAFPTADVDLRRPLRPHVTLVRARSPRRVSPDALAAASAPVAGSGKTAVGIVSVRSVTLFSSTLRPAGPEYRAIATAPLAR
jgi:2'-5' RNA ligase